jgi:hypothetical protein
MGLVSRIERSIVALDLDSQAQFVSLLDTVRVQLESGRPDTTVARLLGEAFLALAPSPPSGSASPARSPCWTSASHALASPSHHHRPGNQVGRHFHSVRRSGRSATPAVPASLGGGVVDATLR